MVQNGESYGGGESKKEVIRTKKGDKETLKIQSKWRRDAKGSKATLPTYPVPNTNIQCFPILLMKFLSSFPSLYIFEQM